MDKLDDGKPVPIEPELIAPRNLDPASILSDSELDRELEILPKEILYHLNVSLEKGIRLGELLSEKKKRLPHGEFGNWISQKCSFTPRTASNYMGLYQNEEKLKSENVSALSEAYKFLRKLSWRKRPDSGSDLDGKMFMTIAVDPDRNYLVRTAIDAAKEMLDTESESKAMEMICYDWFQAFVDKSEPSRIDLEDVKRWVEKTYGVRATFHDKTGKIV